MDQIEIFVYIDSQINYTGHTVLELVICNWLHNVSLHYKIVILSLLKVLYFNKTLYNLKKKWILWKITNIIFYISQNSYHIQTHKFI